MKIGDIESGRLSKWAAPEPIKFVDCIDKISVGKLNKKALRIRYGGAKE